MTSPTEAPLQPPPTPRRPPRGLLAPSFTLMRVRGIRIGAHWSWLVVFTLISWSLARNLFPLAYPGLSPGAYLAMGVISSLIFFACILLHELGHAFQAMREGMKIADITLWLFGGVARFEGSFPSAGAEFRIAVAGPVVSAVLVVVFAFLTWLGGLTGLPLPVRGIVDYLARINLAVVVFNLIPALPLDGGRILRAWLWSRSSDFSRATSMAARAGMGFGWVLIGFGLWLLLGAWGISGIWLMVMGLFLLQAARAEAGFGVVRGALQDLCARDLMTPDPVVVSSGASVEEMLERAGSTGHSTFPVVDDGVLKGMVSVSAAGGVGPERTATRVHQIMTGPVVVSGGAPVVDTIEVLRPAPNKAVVIEQGRVIGLLSLADVSRGLQLRSPEAGVTSRRSRRRRTAALVTVAALLPLAAAVYQPPVVVLTPATAVDVAGDIVIEGVPVTELTGRYLLVAVNLTHPSGLGAAFAYLDPDSVVLPASRLAPSGVSRQEYLESQRNVFNESQMAAAAAAAEAAGLEVVLRGEGALVINVVEGTPAQGNLRVGDVVVSVDGEPIRLVSDLVAITTSAPAGTAFEFSVERDSETQTIEITSAELEGFNTTNVGVGIITVTRDLEVELPFEIEFRERNIGGPSAGLIYALTIADLLGADDLARGRSIAASGTVQLNGQVGPVGSLREKLRSAEKSGADVLLVPEGEISSVAGEGPRSAVAVMGVQNLSDAMALLNGQA